MKIILVHILITVVCYTVCSQINQENYIDIGSSNVSEGAFLRLASASSFGIKNYKAQTGILWAFSNQSAKRFTGWFLDVSGNFKIKKVPFDAGIFTDLIRSQKLCMRITGVSCLVITQTTSG